MSYEAPKIEDKKNYQIKLGAYAFKAVKTDKFYCFSGHFSVLCWACVC